MRPLGTTTIPGAVLGAVLAGCATTSGAEAPATGAVSGPGIVDLGGAAVNPLADGSATAVVLLFTRSDCPISNRYAPEVNRLHARYAPEGVVFWLVYPDPDEPVERIREHQRGFGYSCHVSRDLRHALVDRAGAEVTPEAAVFVPDGRMVYRGRIDDRFVDFGKARPVPSVRDLDEVLQALVAGRPVTLRTTQAVGCFIPDLPPT